MLGVGISSPIALAVAFVLLVHSVLFLIVHRLIMSRIEFLSAKLGRPIDRILIRANQGCMNLIENPKTKGKYKCKIYSKRPLICQEFQCDYMLGADIGRHVEFRIKSEDII